ncbi:MAG: UDP-N-acetylglucosamine--N-acetylmuramyl-(pentapeptide) pyrophosphoryl-undecaprenol N-acetylglucosamine transferase [Planctomycetota bacterium]|nr:UDP-N-acetylglucosamine--N-acetylmuramyl-(pentapeptide) pyrophosphoryl-undecaprenol N-acetylglucosamine transferase [Planctomycetota bacterium]
MTQQMADRFHVVFSGGLTGGHLFPGIAVAERLRRIIPNGRITFSGSGCPFDHGEVARSGFAYFSLPAAPAPRSPRRLWPFLTKNFQGLRRAAEFIGREQVSLVVGLGGYSSVPMAWAAARAGKSLVLLEQNVVPGRATRWLASSASLLCLSWKTAEGQFYRAANAELTGNPVRTEFTFPRHSASRSKRRLVVLGGSQGARQLNDAVPAALAACRDALVGWEIVHQSGRHDWATTTRLYERASLPACVVPFILNPAAVLRKSDLAIGRSGGTTLAELAAVGVPGVLVPLPNSAGGHQRQNALHLAEAGAAVCINSASSPAELVASVASSVKSLVSKDEYRTGMATAMSSLSHPFATSTVVERILELLNRNVSAAA